MGNLGGMGPAELDEGTQPGRRGLHRQGAEAELTVNSMVVPETLIAIYCPRSDCD